MLVFGTLAVWLGLVSMVACIVLYGVSLRQFRQRNPRSNVTALLARRCYYTAAACVLAVAATLQTLLQTHRFDVNYVYHYSARELNPFYLFATFWAGQEGSFLLWAFWIALLGVVLVKRHRLGKRRRDPPFRGVRRQISQLRQ